jgi:DNA-binding transcriptional MerR regulator
MEKALPSIPAKRYFTIGEVSDLCGVKPYVLRYWEQEFTQLKPMKRRGNRRYYQHHEVLLIRRIRDLLYEQGFTISGARNRLTEMGSNRSEHAAPVAELADEPNGADPALVDLDDVIEALEAEGSTLASAAANSIPQPEVATIALSIAQMREELESIRSLLAI